jgi:phosphatidylinositol-3,4,5-trisphosphate 3-phosphatase/dual-specificity protein phosphatase PTEN
MTTNWLRKLVSQKKRRFTTDDGKTNLDLSYITENIIAMGFPAGDKSSGVFINVVEGFYRNHMKHVISFLEQRHPNGTYKIYNLCSERTYDAALFDGKVASFPFDDHNCPPLRLIEAFVQSAKSWLRQSMNHVVVIHCKAGKSRTGLMICCLLIYLNYADTAEEAIAYYNLRRTHDGKGLTLASQQRYLRYYELSYKQPEEGYPEGKKKFLRSIRLHHTAPHLFPMVFVTDHFSDRMLFSSKMVYGDTKKQWKIVDALCAEFTLPLPIKVEDDFKIKMKDKAGEYYLWLNTRYIKQNQVMLEARELDRYKYRNKAGLNWNLLVELNFSDELPE